MQLREQKEKKKTKTTTDVKTECFNGVKKDLKPKKNDFLPHRLVTVLPHIPSHASLQY